MLFLIETIYNNAFIIVAIVNFISLFIINHNYFSLFVYLNSISLNYILYKDFYFEIKHKYSNINFIFLPNYYPSNRTINKYTIFTNITIIYVNVIILCYDFWLNNFIGFKYESFYYLFSLFIFSFSSSIIILGNILILSYGIFLVSSYLSNVFKQIIFNYENDKPLFSSIKNNDIYYCWICQKMLSKHKTLKKLNCPCQEYFHPDCIDKYLGLYDNYCKNGHKIAKFEHTV